MNQHLKDRLNGILSKIQSREFLASAGLGNEIGFYIFDYPPEDELQIRKHISILLERIAQTNPELRVSHVNLFKMMIDHLRERRLLDGALEFQRKGGDAALRKALKGPLDAVKLAQILIAAARPAEHHVVLLSGVGNAWPLLRSHTLLNNLHHTMQRTPLVVFYPGVYDGQKLKLFGRLNDTPYYRAFRLVA